MRVLAFGDSITQGYWDSKGGWVNRLRKYYDEQKLSGKEDDPPTIFNLGVSTDSSSDVLARIDSETKARDRYKDLAFIIAIGVNDARTKSGKSFTDTDRYLSNLNKIVKIAQLYTNRIMFVGLTPCVEERSNPVAWSDTGYTNERIWHFELALRKFCEQNSLPIVKVFELLSEKQKQNELFPDGIHPNDKGHELIAGLVKPKLEELLSA